jgi:hypothetical protein
MSKRGDKLNSAAHLVARLAVADKFVINYEKVGRN